MSEPNTAAELYEAVGRAVAQWSRVEDAFCDLFIRLVLCAVTGGGVLGVAQGYPILGAVFYSTTNFRSRLDLLDHLMCRLVSDASLLAEWNAIKNKAGVLYQRRNTLAHGTAWGRDGIPEAMSYSIFATRARQIMDYRRVCAATPSFTRYAERITKLAIAVNGHLARRQRQAPSPPAP